MNPWITNFIHLVISSHETRVGAREASQWACPIFISVVCVSFERDDNEVWKSSHVKNSEMDVNRSRLFSDFIPSLTASFALLLIVIDSSLRKTVSRSWWVSCLIDVAEWRFFFFLFFFFFFFFLRIYQPMWTTLIVKKKKIVTVQSKRVCFFPWVSTYTAVRKGQRDSFPDVSKDPSRRKLLITRARAPPVKKMSSSRLSFPHFQKYYRVPLFFFFSCWS